MCPIDSTVPSGCVLWIVLYQVGVFYCGLYVVSFDRMVTLATTGKTGMIEVEQWDML